MPTNKIAHSPSHQLEYNHITDGIYIGTNMCCQTHFEESLLEKEGIKADISLEAERIDAAFGVNFYLWLPVNDKKAPTPDQLKLGIANLKAFVSMGKKVYVHCQNGHGRAPTLVAAYLIAKGKTVTEAIEFIKSKRPSIHLEEVQEKALTSFASIH